MIKFALLYQLYFNFSPINFLREQGINFKLSQFCLDCTEHVKEKCIECDH